MKSRFDWAARPRVLERRDFRGMLWLGYGTTGMGGTMATLAPHRRSTAALAAALMLTGLAHCARSNDDGGQTAQADRMAVQHADDRPVSSGAATAQPASAVDESTAAYATVGGKAVQGFLARPRGGGAGAPGIIVIHEWWGLNDNIRSMARRFAGEGYAALAVDLYEGQVASDPARARELMSASTEREAELEDNLRQAQRFLKAQGAPRVGVIGWCFGGGWALRTALAIPDGIDAAVIYYGQLVTEPERLAALRAPVLGIFGGVDEGIPVDSVLTFERVLKELGREVEIHIYDGAGHAFANPSGTHYVPEAAEDAWAKTLTFLARHLRGTGQPE